MIKVFFKHIFIRIHVHAYIYLYKMGKSQLSKNKLFVCFLSNVKILFGIWSGRWFITRTAHLPFLGKSNFGKGNSDFPKKGRYAVRIINRRPLQIPNKYNAER